MIQEHTINEALVHAAFEYASRMHNGQMYGTEPYVRHLFDVLRILRFRMDRPVNTVLLSAGWLHDAIEDTEATRDDIQERFGRDVADIVWACTGVGANRKERNAMISERLRIYHSAVIVKLADRLANVESCWKAKDTRLFMYYREHKDFRKALLDADPTVAGETALAALDQMLGWRG